MTARATDDVAHLPGTSHPRRQAILVVCCAGLFALVVSLTSLNVALPELQRELDATASGLQWIVDSYAIVFGGLLLTGGAVGDRVGRRAALMGGFTLFALGAATGALAGSVTGVIGGRAIAGLGGALLMPATLATITDVFDERDAPRAIAIWAGVAGAGGAFGPAIGGWLIDVWSWRAVFVANGIIAVVGVLGVLAVVPRLPGRKERRLDIPGAILSTAAIGALLFAVIEAPGRWTDPWVIGAAVAAVALIAAFVWHEATTEAPMLPLRVFRSKRRRAGLGTLLFAATGFAGVIFVGALLLQIGWGESPLAAGLLLLPIGVAELSIAWRAPDLCARFSVSAVVLCGLVLMAAGYIVMATTPVGDRQMFVVAGIVAGIGNGLTIPPSVDRVISGAEPELAGVTAGVEETAIELGASLGVGILGGVQRVVLDARLPEGTPSEDVSEAIVAVGSEVVQPAYVDSARAALLAAAVAVLAATPWALGDRRPRRKPSSRTD
ncbi:MAG: MFS transporter [Actinomycetota bacterium]